MNTLILALWAGTMVYQAGFGLRLASQSACVLLIAVSQVFCWVKVILSLIL